MRFAFIPCQSSFQELEEATLSSCSPEQGMQDTQNRIGQVQSTRLSNPPEFNQELISLKFAMNESK